MVGLKSNTNIVILYDNENDVPLFLIIILPLHLSAKVDYHGRKVIRIVSPRVAKR